MAPRESEPQKETVERVMHEFKHGELRSGTSGQKVKNRKQAVAIALSEAGASNQQTPKENEEHLRRTQAKERRGETAQAETEGGAPRSRRSAPDLSWTLRRDFLRLWRGDHIGAWRNNHVRSWLGQVGTLVGLRFFQRRRWPDHVRLGDWCRLAWPRRRRHDAICSFRWRP
jgi:hypothetical protein